MIWVTTRSAADFAAQQRRDVEPGRSGFVAQGWLTPLAGPPRSAKANGSER